MIKKVDIYITDYIHIEKFNGYIIKIDLDGCNFNFIYELYANTKQYYFFSSYIY